MEGWKVDGMKRKKEKERGHTVCFHQTENKGNNRDIYHQKALFFITINST